MDLRGQVPQKCPCANEIFARQEAAGRAIFVTRARQDPQVALAIRVGWLAPTRSCDLAPRTFVFFVFFSVEIPFWRQVLQNFKTSEHLQIELSK